jgi:hypothetical protein
MPNPWSTRFPTLLWSCSVKRLWYLKEQSKELEKVRSLKILEDPYAQHRRREDRVDFTLGLGSPDPDLIGGVSPAWVYLR